MGHIGPGGEGAFRARAVKVEELPAGAVRPGPAGRCHWVGGRAAAAAAAAAVCVGPNSGPGGPVQAPGAFAFGPRDKTARRAVGGGPAQARGRGPARGTDGRACRTSCMPGSQARLVARWSDSPAITRHTSAGAPRSASTHAPSVWSKTHSPPPAPAQRGITVTRPMSLWHGHGHADARQPSPPAPAPSPWAVAACHGPSGRREAVIGSERGRFWRGKRY